MSDGYGAVGVLPPRFKPASQYLTHPVWVGDGVPRGFMGVPWGLGGECWCVQVRVPDPGSELGWSKRKTFAGMVLDEVVAAAQRWLDDGGPYIAPFPARMPEQPVPTDPVPGRLASPRFA